MFWYSGMSQTMLFRKENFVVSTLIVVPCDFKVVSCMVNTDVDLLKMKYLAFQKTSWEGKIVFHTEIC